MKITRLLMSMILGLWGIAASAQWNSVSPENPSNPTDKIGRDHNAALDEIVQLRTKDPLLIQVLMPCYLPYFLKRNKYDAEAVAMIESNPEVIRRLDFDPSRTPEEQLKVWAGKELITQKQFDYVSRIYKLVDNVEQRYYDLGGDAVATYMEFKNQMMVLEEEMLKSLDEKERDLCLATAATSRHSIYYWMSQSLNQPSPWSVPPSDKVGYYLKTNWSQVGKADAAGAVGGAVKFGVCALFGGPVGWGAFAGAVVGSAIGGSVANAISQWWH